MRFVSLDQYCNQNFLKKKNQQYTVLLYLPPAQSEQIRAVITEKVVKTQSVSITIIMMYS